MAEGDLAPAHDSLLRFARGIELGSIVQLGTKHSRTMGMTEQRPRAGHVIVRAGASAPVLELTSLAPFVAALLGIELEAADGEVYVGLLDG